MQGFRQVRSALTDLVPVEHAVDALGVTDLFNRELDEYAEIIVGPGRVPVGFMTRGDDASFGERCRTALEVTGMPAAAIERQRALASWFEHKRAFFKMEWHRTGQGVEPLAACYFRRRPPVDDVVTHLGDAGVAPPVLEYVQRVARTLDKSTVHFVSAAFRPGHPVHHKLYFSQFAPADLRADVAGRIDRMFDLAEIAGPARERWRAHHPRCVPGGEPTIFLSISFTDDRVAPTFKIDYPEVSPATAAAWLDANARRPVEDDAGLACDLARIHRLSFLGVRFARDQAAPGLKYYADVPGSS